MRLAAQAKGGYYPTPERVVDLIAELIHTPSSYHNRGRETIRILDPCCGGGDALQRLAEGLDRPNALPIETYGVELHRDRAEEAEKRLYRTLASDLFATSIANGAFGLLLLNPPYDYDSEDKRTEHAFLTQTTRYLGRERPAGLHCPQAAPRGLGPLPVHPLRADAMLGLPRPGAAGLRPGGAHGLPEGRPRSRRPRARAWCWSGRWGSRSRCAPSATPTGSSAPPPCPAATSCSPRGTVDPVAAATEARRSGLWANTDITDSLWPAGDSRTRPLMPLRRGHMAMLVAAGFLDNLVLEAEGKRILVKGRTSKEMELVEDSPEKEVHREKLRTDRGGPRPRRRSRSPTSQRRRPAQASRTTRPRHPSTGYRRGLASFRTQRNTPS